MQWDPTSHIQCGWRYQIQQTSIVSRQEQEEMTRATSSSKGSKDVMMKLGGKFLIVKEAQWPRWDEEGQWGRWGEGRQWRWRWAILICEQQWIIVRDNEMRNNEQVRDLWHMVKKDQRRSWISTSKKKGGNELKLEFFRNSYGMTIVG